MKNFKLEGVVVYVPTPITDSDEVDIEEYKRHLKYVVAGGCNAIIPGGAAGQQISLSWEEHRKIMRTVIDDFGDQVSCIGYTSSPYTKEAINRTLDAKELGADSVNLLAPWYTLPSSEEIYLYFKSIAEAVGDYPITLYNNERRPNVVIPWQVTVRLAKEHKNIVGIKESNLRNVYFILTELREVRPDFTVINGTSDFFLPYFMALGGHGGFSWIENIAPGLVSVPLFKALKKNDYEKAREILFQYRDLIDLFNVLDPVPVNIHFMLNSMGWKMGAPRAPYAYPPSKENQEKYLSVLRKYNLIKK